VSKGCHLNLVTAANYVTNPEQLLEDFPYWKRLHGFWHTLQNFNPYTASSEPEQNLAAEAFTFIQNRGASGDKDSDLSDDHEDTSLSPADDIGGNPDEDSPGAEEHIRNVNFFLLFLTFAQI